MVGESSAEKKEVLEDLQKKWGREWFKTVIEEIFIIIAKDSHTGSIMTGTILWKKHQRRWNLEEQKYWHFLKTPFKKWLNNIYVFQNTNLRNCVNEGTKDFLKILLILLNKLLQRNPQEEKKPTAVCSLQLWGLWQNITALGKHSHS